MRVASSLWVSAYRRRCEAAGAFVIVAKKGASEAGAVHLRVQRADASIVVYSPAPQAAFETGRPSGRMWIARAGGEPMDPASAQGLLDREIRFDPDLWIVDVEDREGRPFLLDEELAG